MSERLRRSPGLVLAAALVALVAGAAAVVVAIVLAVDVL
jgi:hypothetical protein